METTAFDKLISLCEEAGAKKAFVIETGKIPFDKSLRGCCEANYCGCYGKNWGCPPGVGEVDDLIAQATSYSYALVFQTVSPLEDSFDVDGMAAAGEHHAETAKKIRSRIGAILPSGTKYLELEAGGCRICRECAALTGEPCRFPDKMIPSLESYCVNVANLAAKCQMKYINGENTVTHFGAFLW